jgi:myxalamid-type polyketide synthase MxaB
MVVHSLGAACANEGPNSAAGVDSLSSFLILAQVFCSERLPDTPRLVLATLKGRLIPGDDPKSVSTPAQGSLWGAFRSISLELAHAKARAVDYELGTPASAIAAELLRPAAMAESEVALRADPARARLVPRLAPTTVEPFVKSYPGKQLNKRAVVGTLGAVSSVQMAELEADQPGPHEIQLAVAAVGLNFKDVLVATGIIHPHEATINRLDWPAFGYEVAGVVTKVGAGVSRFKTGDRVYGISFSALETVATMDDYLADVMPATATFEEAVTVPMCYATAYCAMVTLGHLQKDQWILVHTASGGVGISAIAIAKKLGAKVIATVSTRAKAEFIRQLGVEHVFSSRTTDFVKDVMEVTGHAGVNVCINTLPFEGLRASVAVMAPDGHVVEISKDSVLADEQLGLLPLRDNVSLHILDLTVLLGNRRVYAELLEPVYSGYSRGEFSPLPLTSFPIDKMPQAFAHLANPHHIGKVVVSVDQAKADSIAPAPPAEAAWTSSRLFSSHLTYLVTGGTRGFGWKVVEWAIQSGARHLLLVSRSGAVSSEVDKYRRRMPCVVNLQPMAADVSSRAEVDRVLAEISARGMPPLGGVFHAATVYRDAVLETMAKNLGILSQVMAAKAHSAWHLHEATKGMATVHSFVLFSSITAITGRAGQANYCAANAFLDELAAYRRAVGLPAISISFGAIGGAGLLAEMAAMEKILAADGVLPIDAALAASKIRDIMQQEKHSHMALVSVDWPLFFRSQQSLRPLPRLSSLAALAAEQGGSRSSGSSDLSVSAITARLRARFSVVLGHKPEDLADEAILSEMGLNSLSGASLSSWISGEFGISFSVTSLLRVGVTLAKIASDVAALAAAAAGVPVPSAAEPAVSQPAEILPNIPTPTQTPAPRLTSPPPAMSPQLPVGSPVMSPQAKKPAVATPVTQPVKPQATKTYPNVKKERLDQTSQFLTVMAKDMAKMFNLPVDTTNGHQQIEIFGKKKVLMMASPDYLSLGHHPRVMEANRRALELFGSSVHGSRISTGTVNVHHSVERAIAEFMGCEDCIVFPSGFQANVGLLSTLCADPGDILFSDALNHASLFDGARTAGCQNQIFRHANLDHLESLLKQAPTSAGKIICVDSVFSMEGDIADLPRLHQLAKQYGAVLVVDEAHGAGAIGASGRGIEEFFNLWGVCDFKTGTMSKAFGGNGGWVAGSKAWITWLKYSSRSFVFTSACSPVHAAGVIESLKIMREPEGTALIQRLQHNADIFKKILLDSGFDIFGSKTHIVSLLIGGNEAAVEFSERLLEKGFFAPPVPAVGGSIPDGTARIRTTLTAGMFEEDVIAAANAIVQIGKDMGIVVGKPGEHAVQVMDDLQRTAARARLAEEDSRRRELMDKRAAQDKQIPGSSLGDVLAAPDTPFIAPPPPAGWGSWCVIS